jgi:hypothetical protein
VIHPSPQKGAGVGLYQYVLLVGDLLGESLGAAVGEAVGASVGPFVGELVGVAVGDLVDEIQVWKVTGTSQRMYGSGLVTALGA